jgi:hypothetical protein
MTRRIRRLASVELTTVAVDQITALTNFKLQIIACTVANKTATPYYVTVTLTPSGGTAFNLVYRQVISPGLPTQLHQVVGHVLEPGDKISALAEFNGALDFNLSGTESPK